LIVCRSRTKW